MASHSVPLAGLTVYQSWRDAPLGALVAYATPIFFSQPGQSSVAREGVKIALRAESSHGFQQFLVVLEPEPYLASLAVDRARTAIFGAIEAPDAPAVDLAASYELRIEPAPVSTNPHADPDPLTVIQIQGEKPQTLLFAGTVGRSSRYLVLDGDQKGRLLEGPTQAGAAVGKLLVAPRPRQ